MQDQPARGGCGAAATPSCSTPRRYDWRRIPRSPQAGGPAGGRTGCGPCSSGGISGRRPSRRRSRSTTTAAVPRPVRRTSSAWSTTPVQQEGPHGEASVLYPRGARLYQREGGPGGERLGHAHRPDGGAEPHRTAVARTDGLPDCKAVPFGVRFARINSITWRR